MNENSLTRTIKKYEQDFIKFMRIDSFPNYEIVPKEVSLSIATSQGFESLASSKYDFSISKHILIVSNNLPLKRYIIFHEFTHILDTELYTKNDRKNHIGISGYTEYHASQIELFELLKANSIEDTLSFSVYNKIDTISGEKTIVQYMNDKFQHAVSLFSRNDFPANIETLHAALGVLFNYWGIRSICKLYSTDYSSQENNQAFLKYIPQTNFILLNNMMTGWVDNTTINLSIPFYFNAVFSIIKKYNLN